MCLQFLPLPSQTLQKYVASENYGSTQPSLKRSSSPGSIVPPNAKRNALGDVTNNAPIVGPSGIQPVKQVSLAGKASQPSMTTRAAAKRGAWREPTAAVASSLDESLGDGSQGR